VPVSSNLAAVPIVRGLVIMLSDLGDDRRPAEEVLKMADVDPLTGLAKGSFGNYTRVTG
jgi:hypothetical protein